MSQWSASILVALWSGAAVALQAGPGGSARGGPGGLRAVEEGAGAIFERLSDDYVLVDPSGGTCCRNECNGCSFYEVDEATGAARYAYEEVRGGPRRIAPYASLEVPPASHEAAWARRLFFGGATSIDRGAFLEAFLDAASDEALDAAWRSLTTAPTLTRAQMASRLRQMAGSEPGVDEARFLAAVAAAAEAPRASEEVDYESWETADLKALCRDRGIPRPPPVRRLVIEELRFFDAYGRPGVRNRRTRKLEAPPPL